MNDQPIAIDNPAVLARITALMQQREQIDLALTHTVRTAADFMDVPEGYQFDPQSGTFVPPAPTPAAE